MTKFKEVEPLKLNCRGTAAWKSKVNDDKIFLDCGSLGYDEALRLLSWLSETCGQSPDMVMVDKAALIESVLQHVMELPDRNSPEDQPEMMLVTGEELSTAIEIAFERAAAPRSER